MSCVTDEKWLLFVIEQILSNALKYTRAGSITIELEAPKTLVIRDTGIGVAPEDLPRIFEKGYTGYNGRGDQKASGLGLYLCRTICKRLGHTITASSVPDHGTAIRITLEQRQVREGKQHRRHRCKTVPAIIVYSRYPSVRLRIFSRSGRMRDGATESSSTPRRKNASVSASSAASSPQMPTVHPA